MLFVGHNIAACEVLACCFPRVETFRAVAAIGTGTVLIACHGSERQWLGVNVCAKCDLSCANLHVYLLFIRNFRLALKKKKTILLVNPFRHIIIQL